MEPVYALVVAAASGSRFRGERPKQYLSLGGQTVLRHAVAALVSHPGIAGVQVMMRTYIVKDRLYRLLVTATADPKTREAANRFLNKTYIAAFNRRFQVPAEQSGTAFLPLGA